MAMFEKEFKIDWSSRSELRGPGEKSLGDLVHKLRDHLDPEAQGVSISYVDNRIMKKLNREHRGINQTTDVLSFPAQPEKGAFKHLGDIVICLPVAEKMAKKFKVSRRREVETLTIHGFLHLCGYDHEKDGGKMMALQAQLEKELLGEEPLRMSLKRGRKTGSKVKKLEDGTRVVITGRAAKAQLHKEQQKKTKPSPKVASKKMPNQPKRGPGRPRKTPVVTQPSKRTVKRSRTTLRLRSGIIA